MNVVSFLFLPLQIRKYQKIYSQNTTIFDKSTLGMKYPFMYNSLKLKNVDEIDDMFSDDNTNSEDDAKTPSQKNLLMEEGNGKIYKS